MHIHVLILVGVVLVAECKGHSTSSIIHVAMAALQILHVNVCEYVLVVVYVYMCVEVCYVMVCMVLCNGLSDVCLLPAQLGGIGSSSVGGVWSIGCTCGAGGREGE